MSAGYANTPLQKKLGLKPGMNICILHASPGYAETLGPLPEGVHVAAGLAPGLDFVHYFTGRRQDLDAAFPGLKNSLAPDGLLWISWPKKAARVSTDLDGNQVRRIGLAHGLVDVKVCAVDAVWSGLKFVYRLRDRTPSTTLQPHERL